MRIAPVLATAGLLAAGCGGPSYPETYPVTGVVTVKGIPLEGADVQLVPTGGDPATRSAGGKTDADGKFSVKTYFDPQHNPEGAMKGEYGVAVSKLETRDMPADMEPTKAMAQMMQQGGAPKNLVPQKYQSPNTSGFKVTVGDGPVAPLTLELK